MGRTAVFTIAKRSLLLLPCLGFLTGTAWAESGIRIKSGPSVFAGPANPPCDTVNTITFRVEIENTNCVCNEDVNPIQKAVSVLNTGLPDSFGEIVDPLGGFEFLGFKKSVGDPLSPSISFIDMEDETSAEFFFDVRTRPGLGGCSPFVSAQFGIVVCDGGGGCDFGLDLPYPVCESPKHVPTVRLDADSTACSPNSTGTGDIHGTVIDGATGQAVALALVEVTKGCFLLPGFVSRSNFSSLGWGTPIGDYQLPAPGQPGLPAGTYTLKAQEGGRCTSQTVVLADGESKLVNLTLAPGPCP